ncbi:hypothetical protein BXZ70DRAFT_165863 [Cristinia sonorae]|uniref:Uncharacterized protein n=1 Tax=Cristinia sonorae TaxID=1940300 RepID=A0A8K0XQ36_9AGAR|nr:hypothetical protein BXZ70DRAFT_165863 [Cristinia sonorae]
MHSSQFSSHHHHLLPLVERVPGLSSYESKGCCRREILRHCGHCIWQCCTSFGRLSLSRPSSLLPRHFIHLVTVWPFIERCNPPHSFLSSPPTLCNPVITVLLESPYAMRLTAAPSPVYIHPPFKHPPPSFLYYCSRLLYHFQFLLPPPFNSLQYHPDLHYYPPSAHFVAHSVVVCVLARIYMSRFVSAMLQHLRALFSLVCHRDCLLSSSAPAPNSVISSPRSPLVFSPSLPEGRHSILLLFYTTQSIHLL